MLLNEYLDRFRNQDRDGQLIFRYDNAVHRPALSYKDHKHSGDGTISEAILPDIFDLVDEVLRYL